ncbi:MAG: restriction endonuclease [Chloroflexota bacterium]
MTVEIPTFDEFMNPLLQALHALGGSGTIDEINDKTAEIYGLTNEQLEHLHNPEKDTRTEVEYRLAWTRTYLKKYGVLENSSRGVWALAPNARDIREVNPADVVQTMRQTQTNQVDENLKDEVEQEIEEDTNWRTILLTTLLQLEPDAFERLTQRLLREAGFVQVEVLGKSCDGGIEGKGLMRLGGLLSFHVLFQCKRYKGSVGAREMRDFRGALVGRADKGLFITTGNFTQGARDEATRDGAPAIDLIDGDQLIEKLKELSLGVETELVEKVTVNSDWFRNI